MGEGKEGGRPWLKARWVFIETRPPAEKRYDVSEHTIDLWKLSLVVAKSTYMVEYHATKHQQSLNLARIRGVSRTFEWCC